VYRVTKLTHGNMEINLARELTWARTRPGEVTAALQERLKCFKGKDFFPPERKGTAIVTKEGVAAVKMPLLSCEGKHHWEVSGVLRRSGSL